jgi:hypothetical protein
MGAADGAGLADADTLGAGADGEAGVELAGALTEGGAAAAAACVLPMKDSRSALLAA